MAVGFSTMGQCFSTAADAIDNYYSSQPIHYFWLENEMYLMRPMKDAGVWKLGYTTDQIPYINVYAELPTNILGSCDFESGIYSYIDAAAMWGFAFSSVFMLWYLAKNLGMIINAVKRW